MIIVEGNKKIYAHKIFLSRIAYFQAMLNSEMKESVSESITLECISYDIAILILKYIYTDECEITFDVI